LVRTANTSSIDRLIAILFVTLGTRLLPLQDHQ
jgi:hypothetical protein